jgi:hypothetical protein
MKIDPVVVGLKELKIFVFVATNLIQMRCEFELFEYPLIQWR